MKKRNLALLLALVLIFGAIPVRASAASGQKLAAITFDDGPGKYTDNLLNELAKRDVKVTFFMQGYNASRCPSLVRKAYEAGHQIASHTYSHPQLTKLSNDKIREQLNAAASVLNQATGGNLTYMVRPPYGSVNARVLSALNSPAILWSVDTRDWESRNADAVYRHIVNDTRDGSIILLHDIHATSIPGALRGIDALLDQGYELVTVNELLRRRGVDASPGKKIHSAPGSTTLPGIAQPTVTTAETEEGRLITLSADEGVPIYYTTDGSAPNSRSTLYTGPFLLDTRVTIKAFAARNLNGGRSRVTELTLGAMQSKAPVITLKDGKIVMSSKGDIHYTLDGSMPTAYCPLYIEPLAVPAGTTIRAITVQPGYWESPASSRFYSLQGELLSDAAAESGGS